MKTDPVLGFGSVWIRELARRCESVDVISMYRGAVDLPANVRVFSVGREHGWSKAKRLAHFLSPFDAAAVGAIATTSASRI